MSYSRSTPHLGRFCGRIFFGCPELRWDPRTSTVPTQQHSHWRHAPSLQGNKGPQGRMKYLRERGYLVSRAAESRRHQFRRRMLGSGGCVVGWVSSFTGAWCLVPACMVPGVPAQTLGIDRNGKKSTPFLIQPVVPFILGCRYVNRRVCVYSRVQILVQMSVQQRSAHTKYSWI